MRARFAAVLAVACPVALASLLAVRPAAAGTIDPALVDRLERAPEEKIEMLVVLGEQADLTGAARLSDKSAKGRFVFERLTATAARTQAPLLDFLASRGAPAQPFWIHNAVWTRGDRALAEALAARGDVASVDLNWLLKATEPPAVQDDGPFELGATLAVEWNIARVNADDVWALGVTGAGAVIAGQDTGYDWDHPALQGKYRGWNGSSADHDYDWHDAVHADVDGGGVTCGVNSPVPCADGSHGTHTMGTMVGDDGAANQIGMAPGAKWIACRNMENGWGTVAQYTECFQWFVAPTTVAGGSPDPGMAPHVVNNSWGCPFSYPGTPPGAECIGHPIGVMQSVVETVRAAGILVVVSAGNEGSGCSTVAWAPAFYDAAFSVGSTTSTDALSGFSSRGPVTLDGSNRRKPDISAPGSGVRSCIPGTGYSSMSGTSMAGPHVAGLVALLVSANPGKLAGNMDGLEELIREGALRIPSATCSSSAASPQNNLFGWGRIDALASVQLLQAGLVFRDAFETGDTADWSSTLP